MSVGRWRVTGLSAVRVRRKVKIWAVKRGQLTEVKE